MSTYDNMGGEKNMDKIVITGAVISAVVAVATYRMTTGL